MNLLGEKLRELRGSLSLYEVGKATGINRSNIQQYEAGILLPKRKALRALAEFYEVPYEDLFTLWFDTFFPETDEREIITRIILNQN